MTLDKHIQRFVTVLVWLISVKIIVGNGLDDAETFATEINVTTNLKTQSFSEDMLNRTINNTRNHDSTKDIIFSYCKPYCNGEYGVTEENEKIRHFENRQYFIL